MNQVTWSRPLLCLFVWSMSFSGVAIALPARAPEPMRCDSPVFSMVYPRDGEVGVSPYARIIVGIEGSSFCGFDSQDAELTNSAGDLHTTKTMNQPQSGSSFEVFQPTRALLANTKHEFRYGKLAISFTTGTGPLSKEPPVVKLHILLAQYVKTSDNRFQNCTISYQVEGSATQLPAFLHVYHPSGQSGINRSGTNNGSLLRSFPLGVQPLPQETLTTDGRNSEDCDEKQACLYAVAEAADGLWGTPQKVCVKPIIETAKDPKFTTPPTGCEAMGGAPPWGLLCLLLLLPLCLRKSPRVFR